MSTTAAEPAMHIVDQPHAIHVIGVELRTTNDQAATTIPAFWQRCMAEQVLAAIPGKTSADVLAVYTHFEHAGVDNQGLYSLVIGAETDPATTPPAGMVRTVVPAARRAVFPVADGRADQVGTTWQTVWARHDLAKTYVADYERYAAEGGIALYVGIDRAQPGA